MGKERKACSRRHRVEIGHGQNHAYLHVEDDRWSKHLDDWCVSQWPKRRFHWRARSCQRNRYFYLASFEQGIIKSQRSLYRIFVRELHVGKPRAEKREFELWADVGHTLWVVRWIYRTEWSHGEWIHIRESDFLALALSLCNQPRRWRMTSSSIPALSAGPLRFPHRLIFDLLPSFLRWLEIELRNEEEIQEMFDGRWGTYSFPWCRALAFVLPLRTASASVFPLLLPFRWCAFASLRDRLRRRSRRNPTECRTHCLDDRDWEGYQRWWVYFRDCYCCFRFEHWNPCRLTDRREKFNRKIGTQAICDRMKESNNIQNQQMTYVRGQRWR